MFDVQFITHSTTTISHLDSVRIALAGGCRWIQLRLKNVPDEQVEPIARQAQTLCRDVGALLIIDDRVELALKLGVDGIHLGKMDMPIDEARRIVGLSLRIGGTASNFKDIQRLAAAGADYIGCGPLRFTTTKQNLAPTLGIEGYRRIIEQMRTAGITLPIVGIGGITAADIPTLMAIGLNGIALSSSVIMAANPVAEMAKIIELTK